MKHYKDNLGVVYGYEDGQTPDPQLTPISDAEADALRNPPVTAESLKAIVTAFRWEVETGGITLPDGVTVATGIDDQNRITTVVANARLAGLDEVKFKAASGWITLTLAEVEGIAAAIARHVQACFAAECAHHEAIDALVALHKDDPVALQAALEGYDESQGWPGEEEA